MAMRPRAPDRTMDASALWASEAPAGLRAEEGATGFESHAAQHGGRLAAAMAAFPRAPRPWLDLSTGINPDPWKGPRATLDQLARLPDPVQLAELEAAAAAAFGVADPAQVVATAGAEAGLRLLPRALYADDVDIVSPTYSSHEAAWRSSPARVYRITSERVRASAAHVLTLVNPNNPDGRSLERASLGELIARRTARRVWTVVDESFVETDPDLSVADLASDRLIVLRSFGKFYGLPGLRLGFVIAPIEIAQRLRALQGEWPVGAEAIAMATRAYGDHAWRVHAEGQLRLRAEEFDRMLDRRGLRVLGGTSLFRLVSVADAGVVFDGLCRAGVLTRPFARREDWLRFGLPRREDFTRLDIALRQAVR